MNKYALIGKDISHSRSPEMYRKLISPDVHYDLLDYKNAGEIPAAQKIFETYSGINITSPYKKHFLNQIELTENARDLGAVNCLKKDNGKIIGENTDYLAIRDILKELKLTHHELEVIILGDGVMSNVVQMALEKLNISFKVLSRKLTNDFNQLNLNNYFSIESAKPLVINTCAREYVFSGLIPKQSIFWDFNYNFPQHSQGIFHHVEIFMDGLDMLERQAFYAVAFWSNHHKV